jgi:NCAIR mutase (PurE)-related protein
MNVDRLRSLLEGLRDGKVSTEEALKQLRTLPYADLGFAKVDRHRELRTGFPETVLCLSKTTQQVVEIMRSLAEDGSTVLATKADEEKFAALVKEGFRASYNAQARMIVVNALNPPPSDAPFVLVATGGTGDIPVAEEAAVTAEAAGQRVERVYDVGVAGLHRLFGHLAKLQEAEAIVVVAGMEGALPSVVAGLVDRPVIAVPSSVGYGASFGGVAALLAMLNSCAPGVVVVNIDNGYGAGLFAAMIARRTSGRAVRAAPKRKRMEKDREKD